MQLDELGADLLRQLAGGDEDDARGVVGLGAAHAGEHRDAEGEGLAEAVGARPEKVAPGEGVGQAGGLHGERSVIRDASSASTSSAGTPSAPNGKTL